jgi:hypothetical protein
MLVIVIGRTDMTKGGSLPAFYPVIRPRGLLHGCVVASFRGMDFSGIFQVFYGLGNFLAVNTQLFGNFTGTNRLAGFLHETLLK